MLAPEEKENKMVTIAVTIDEELLRMIEASLHSEEKETGELLVKLKSIHI